MKRKSKYDNDFIKKIVNEVALGNKGTAVACKYRIPKSTVNTWVKQYKDKNIETDKSSKEDMKEMHKIVTENLKNEIENKCKKLPVQMDIKKEIELRELKFKLEIKDLEIKVLKEYIENLTHIIKNN